jgi:hypothetical protein
MPSMCDNRAIINPPNIDSIIASLCPIIAFIHRGAAWEDKFLDTVGEYEETGHFKHIQIARFASRTLDHELEKNTRTVIPYFSSTFILMAVFRYVLFDLSVHETRFA